MVVEVLGLRLGTYVRSSHRDKPNCGLKRRERWLPKGTVISCLTKPQALVGGIDYAPNASPIIKGE